MNQINVYFEANSTEQFFDGKAQNLCQMFKAIMIVNRLNFIISLIIIKQFSKIFILLADFFKLLIYL